MRNATSLTGFISAGHGLKAIGTAAAMLFTIPVHAQQPPLVERVLVKDGQVLAVQGGATNQITRTVALPNDITVMTNCTFRIKEGKERGLKEGQVLSADGMLLSPDGGLEPVADHVVLRNGQVAVVRDGESAALQGTLTLGDGSTVTADGYYTKPNGAREKLLDGQMYGLDGRPIPALDTIMLRQGQVRVQKDGSFLAVAADRSMMMNDGTKVLGDGTVVMPNGTTRKLAEGEILIVPGVIRNAAPTAGGGQY